jgi:hypothetical protein
MTSTDLDSIVDDYLHRLDTALKAFPSARRQQLVSEIAEHLEEARSELSTQTEVTVRQLLDRVGLPEDIAAEALADEQRPDARRPSRRMGIVLAVVAAVLGLCIGLTFALAGGENRTTTTTTRVPTTTVRLVVIPDVVGQTVDQAGTTLISHGLQLLGRVVSGPESLSGIVVSQSPAAGSKVPRGSLVTLEVGIAP